jgi:hypothetical protein
MGRGHGRGLTLVRRGRAARARRGRRDLNHAVADDDLRVGRRQRRRRGLAPRGGESHDQAARMRESHVTAV